MQGTFVQAMPETVMVLHKSQRRPQGTGDARNTGYLPRNISGTEQSQLQKGSYVCSKWQSHRDETAKGHWSLYNATMCYRGWA